MYFRAIELSRVNLKTFAEKGKRKMRKGFLVFAALLLVGTYAFGQVTPIHDIQYVPDPATDDASPLVGNVVTIEAWVTFEPLSGGGNKWNVADDAGAWNGIYVYGNPGRNYGFGWKLSLTGLIAEYNNLTEFDIRNYVAQAAVIDSVVDWTALPAACDYTEVPVAGLDAAATAEQYEGVLVKVAEVTCSALPDQYGEWQIQDALANIANVDNPRSTDYGYFHTPQLNMPYEYLRGVLHYDYSHYKIVPEIAYDLKVQATAGNEWYTPIAWFQQVRPMDMTARVDAEGDYYTNDYSYASLIRYGYNREVPGDTLGHTQYVKVHGLATAPTGLFYAGTGVKFIMTDFDNSVGVSAPWSSILAYYYEPQAFPEVAIGDEVVFFGFIDEYLTGAGHMTELWITAPAAVQGEDNPIPTPPLVRTADLRDPLTAEQWGNVFVEVNDAVVTNDNPQYEMFIIDDDLSDNVPGIAVDDDSESLRTPPYTSPPIGTNITSITGWIYHYYGVADPLADDWMYKLCPQGPTDIVIGEGPPIFLAVSRNPGVPGAEQEVVISADVSDNSQVVSVTIHWQIGGGELQEIAMTNTGGINWEGTIPGQPEGTDVWYYLEAEDDLATTTTSPSDILMGLYGYWAMDEIDIYAIQYTPFLSGASPYDGCLVTVSGVVTTNPENYNGVELTRGDDPPTVYGRYEGYFMQVGDDYPYSGICFSMPEGATEFPRSGNYVTVTGTVDESGSEWNYKWGDNTKLVDVVEVQIHNYGGYYEYYPVDAALVNLDREAFESVMVEFTDLTITAINQYDWTFEDASGGNFLLDDDMIYEENMLDWYDGLTIGSTIDTLRGVITYSFGSWKVEPRGSGDCSEVETVVREYNPAIIPISFSLAPVYPNPFNPTTTIRYSIPSTSHVYLTVYNLLGQAVRNLVNEPMEPGVYTAQWDGLNKYDAPVSSGTYFVRLRADGKSKVQKLVLTK